MINYVQYFIAVMLSVGQQEMNGMASGR